MKLDAKGILLLIVLVAAVSTGSMLFTFRFFQPVQPEIARTVEAGQEVPMPEHTIDMDVFTVNLASAQGRGPYLRTAIVLQASDEAALQELEARRPQVRDRVLDVLRQQTREAFERPDALDRLKGLVLDAVNPLLVQGRVVNVYITEFIIQ
ncbi:MAG TPA: flagellar basal body-associated FliL family protein [Limnochordia bacterium]